MLIAFRSLIDAVVCARVEGCCCGFLENLYQRPLILAEFGHAGAGGVYGLHVRSDFNLILAFMQSYSKMVEK